MIPRTLKNTQLDVGTLYWFLNCISLTWDEIGYIRDIIIDRYYEKI
mgnify:FL=1